MPLTETQIADCAVRYEREYDRYSKMAEVVYAKCLEIVQKKLTIRATVQRRAKNPKSFADKLRKETNRIRYDSVADVFTGISDLAGVRIATYLESDRESVIQEIKNQFVGKDGQEPEVDQKDLTAPGKHYRATHCQVFLPDGDCTGNNENLKNTTCEIQVCSLLAHVFNEIEHDLQYKPLSGELSPAETEFIDQLGLITRAGDLTIKRLLSETDNRLSQRTGKFDDVHDFVARMRKELPNQTQFSDNAGQLYEELQALDLVSPESIHKAVCKNGEDIASISQQEFDRLKEYEGTQGLNLLEERSSDALLTAILREKVDDVLRRHPMGRGKGRPTRLAQIAKQYKQMTEQSKQA